MQIVIFGLGNFFEKNREKISSQDKIVAYLDNNRDLWGQQINGTEIYAPSDIVKVEYEKIILMSVHQVAMKKQLLAIGCQENDIWSFEEYLFENYRGYIEVYFPIKTTHGQKGKSLIITSDVGYHGGAMAAAYAAMELIERGYSVTIACPEGDIAFINEMRQKGVTFIIDQCISFEKWDTLSWICNFNHIIVNTLPMLPCVLELAKYRKVLFWLHEAVYTYEQLNFEHDYMEKAELENIYIFAVSSVAKQNFVKFFGMYDIKILPFGIPDIYTSGTEKRRLELCFATIGSIYPIKGQDIYLDAIELLGISETSFWIVGKKIDRKYYAKIEEKTKELSGVVMIDEMQHKELEAIYEKIDIVVVPSREETMSFIAVEAMMLGKVCIVSDTVGIAEYITNGVNGFTFKSGDAADLATKMKWCMENRGELWQIGCLGRKTYETYFELQDFGERLEEAIIHVNNDI